SAAAAGGSAAFADVAAAAGTHLGAAGQTKRSVDTRAGDFLEELRGRASGNRSCLCSSGIHLVSSDLITRIVLERLSFAELVLRRQIRSGLDLTRTLGRRIDTELGPLLEGQVVQSQPPEDVVHDRLCHPDVWVVCQASGLELEVGELLDEGFQGHPGV